MNVFKVFLSVIIFMSEDIQNISCSKTSETSFDFFHNNSKAIHHTINNIFTSLNLNQSFKKSTKIRLLIAMHKNLINILKHSYKYDEIENGSDNITVKEFWKHDNKIDKILEKEYNTLFILVNDTMQKDFQNNTLNRTFSEDFSGNVNYAFSNIDTMTNTTEDYNNIIDESANNTDLKKTYETPTEKVGRRTIPHNLKTWVPDAHQIYAFNRRIFKSKITKIRKYPFLASVHVSGTFVCGGSIISKDHIITAASCLQTARLNQFNKNYKHNITVRMGSDFTAYGGLSAPIAFIHFHPQYQPQSLKNNLAILRIGKHKAKKKRVRRVLFDKTQDDFPNDVKRVTIIGWGGKTKKEKQSSRLAVAHLDLYDLEDCKAVYAGSFVSETNFCAGFITKGSGACKKDIGDPAVIAGVLVGVVSFGPPVCGTPDAPTVFTVVGRYADWITSVLEMDSTATKPMTSPWLNTLTQIKNTDQSLYAPKQIDRRGVNGLGRINLDLPEELFIMQEILKDIAKSEHSEIKSAIDQGFDDEFLEFVEDHPKVDMIHHPLANKSVFALPGANFPEEIASWGQKQPIIPALTTHRNVGVTSKRDTPFKITESPDYNKLWQMVDTLYDRLHLPNNLPDMLRFDATKQDKGWIKPISTSRGPVVTRTRPRQRRKTTTTTPYTPSVVSHQYLHFDESSDYEGTGSDGGMSIEVKKTTKKPNGMKITQMILESDEYYDEEETLDPDDSKNYLGFLRTKFDKLKSEYIKSTKTYDSTRMMQFYLFHSNEKDEYEDLRNFVARQW